MNNSENRLERKCSCCGGDNPEKQRIDAILEKYADVKGPLIPILQEVQNLYNYLPKDVLEYIADKTGTPISEIYGVVTFYSLFHLNPRGRNVIRVCQGTACHVRGGKTILQALERHKGNLSQGATALGISRAALYRRLEKFGISV